MAVLIPPDSHWRDSARSPRFFLIDYRAAFPLLLCLFHITKTTLIIAGLAILFFALLERYGFTVVVFLRWFRSVLAGPRKLATPWWIKNTE